MNQEEGGMAGVPTQLVFLQPQRGPPRLSRGWRTPDPSPTRGGGAGLPGCKSAHLCMQTLLVHQPWGQQAADKPDMQPKPRASRVSSRTPSPNVRTGAAKMPPGRKGWAGNGGGGVIAIEPPGFGDRACTPRSHMPIPHAEAQQVQQTKTSFASWQLPTPTYEQCEGVADAEHCHGRETPGGGLPLPPQPHSTNRPNAIVKSPNSGPLVSYGSIGHPHTCAPPCKYATKAKGCKDGASCMRCHQCEWRRYTSRHSTSSKTAVFQ